MACRRCFFIFSRKLCAAFKIIITSHVKWRNHKRYFYLCCWCSSKYRSWNRTELVRTELCTMMRCTRYRIAYTTHFKSAFKLLFRYFNFNPLPHLRHSCVALGCNYNSRNVHGIRVNIERKKEVKFYILINFKNWVYIFSKYHVVQQMTTHSLSHRLIPAYLISSATLIE